MYSNAQNLPPLSAITSEQHPLCLIAPTAPPSLPTGDCRFILLHPSILNQRCTCQCFHHNGKPGSLCDCGHQACYHVHSQQQSGSSSPATPILPPIYGSDPSIAGLIDKVQKLEEALGHQQAKHEEALRQERQARERDIRILREALHPFYKTETTMRKKLVELEDRVEGNYDEQVRWMERLIEVDDAAMNLEKRLDEIDGPKPKRRRASRQHAQGSRKGSEQSGGPSPPSSTISNVPQPDAAQIDGIGNVRPRDPRPMEGPYTLEPLDSVQKRPRPSERLSSSESGTYGESSRHPRSSGILDTTKLPSYLPPIKQHSVRPASRPQSPRSSGVLDLQSSITGPVVDSSLASPTIMATSMPFLPTSLAPMFEADKYNINIQDRPVSIPVSRVKGKAIDEHLWDMNLHDVRGSPRPQHEGYVSPTRAAMERLSTDMSMGPPPSKHKAECQPNTSQAVPIGP